MLVFVSPAIAFSLCLSGESVRNSNEAFSIAFQIVSASREGDYESLSRSLTTALNKPAETIRQVEANLGLTNERRTLDDFATSLAVNRILSDAGKRGSQKPDRLLSEVQQQLIAVAKGWISDSKAIKAEMEKTPSVDEQLDKMEDSLANIANARSVVDFFSNRKPSTQKKSRKAQEVAAEDVNRLRSHYEEETLEILSDLIVRLEQIIGIGSALLDKPKAEWSDRVKTVIRIRRALRLLEIVRREQTKRSNKVKGDLSPGDFEKLAAEVTTKVQTEGNELSYQAYHLDQFMYWWIRGRFGRSTLGEGLVKQYPRQARHLENYFLTQPLWIPTPIGCPADPAADMPGPSLNYIPVRFLQYSLLGNARWQQRFPSDRDYELLQGVLPVDETLGEGARDPFQLLKNVQRPPDHVVGFVEYKRALQHLEALTGRLTEPEIKDLSRFIEEDDRFAIHSNLSRVYDRFVGNSSLIGIITPSKHPKAKGRFERRGLNWAVAHAILEVQGIISCEQMIEERSSYFDPDIVPVFAQSAYRELLFDATRLAYYGLLSTAKAADNSVVFNNLAMQWKFQERCVITQNLVTASMERNRNDPEFQGERLTELQTWHDVVARLRGTSGGIVQGNRPGVTIEMKGPDPAAVQAVRDAIGQAVQQAGLPAGNFGLPAGPGQAAP